MFETKILKNTKIVKKNLHAKNAPMLNIGWPDSTSLEDLIQNVGQTLCIMFNPICQTLVKIEPPIGINYYFVIFKQIRRRPPTFDLYCQKKAAH